MKLKILQFFKADSIIDKHKFVHIFNFPYDYLIQSKIKGTTFGRQSLPSNTPHIPQHKKYLKLRLICLNES